MENLVGMFEELRQTYKGKKVFLTGHTGFKGSWLLSFFSLLGAEVKGYALSAQTDDDLYHLIEGSQLCDSVIADIRDRERLIREMRSFAPDFVFHLAAQPLVRLSYQIPSETFDVNATGTANVLDGIRQLENPCYAVLITTDKVYHNYEWEYPYRENDRLGGYDPYSASKACAELVIDSYRNSFFNPGIYSEHQKAISVARAGNVIGGGDWSTDRLVPDIVRALSKGNPIMVRNPVSVRPWQHVLEPLTGYLQLGVKLMEEPVKFSQAFNFGPLVTDALPVKTMVDIAIKEWGSGQYQTPELANQVHEAGLLKLDISKANTALNWWPKLNASEAVRDTILWYKAFFVDPHNIPEFTRQQILNFIKL